MPVTHGVTGSSPVRTAIKITQYQSFGSVAQLNRASDYGSEGYRFESCRSHEGFRNRIADPFFMFLVSEAGKFRWSVRTRELRCKFSFPVDG